MDTIVDLHGQLAHLEDNIEFVADLCRYAENILSEAAVRKNTGLPKAPGKPSVRTTRWSRKSRPRN